MRINSDSLLGNSDIKFQEASGNIQKSIMQLVSGDKFKGIVSDIKPDFISIKMSDGSIINAKASGLTGLVIGQQAEFIVKQNNSNQIMVEISKNNSILNNNSLIAEALKNADLPITEQNAEVVKMLMDNNMPIDRQNIDNAMFFKYQLQNQDNNTIQFSEIKDKILFLLEEQFYPDENSISSLNRFIDEHMGIKNSIFDMANSIINIKDKNIKNQILKVIGFDIKNDNIDKNSIKDFIKNKFFIDIDNDENINSVSEKFSKLNEIVKNAESIISSSNADISELKNVLENIKDDINFMENINNYKEFIQIPINVNGNYENCELYVFKDGKRKNISEKNASMLLSIDFPSLGRIETFIEKQNKMLSFQFRFQNDEFINLLKNNIQVLHNMLNEKGFTISSVLYKAIDEPFSIIKNNNNKNIKVKNYSFDMRI